MHVALTLYRGLFWVPFGRGSMKACLRAADIAERSRGERTRIISQVEWDKEQLARKRERADLARAERYRQDVRIELATERLDLLRQTASLKRA